MPIVNKRKKKQTIKTLNQTIPEEKFYKYLSIVLIGVILGFTGWLIYQQYNPDVQPELTTEVDKKFNDKLSCLNYCQDTFKNNPLNLTIDEVDGGLKITNADKYYIFTVPQGTEIVENSELEGISINFPETSCQVPLKILHADSTGLSTEDWINVNYPDQIFEETELVMDQGSVYKTEWGVTDTNSYSYFFLLNENVIEASYIMGFLTSSECDEGAYKQQVEETIKSFRSMKEAREYFELLGD